MQRRASVFSNYTIEAPDGLVGHVSDILFEDNDWKLRWFVVNTGSWLSARKLLIHPAMLGRPDIGRGAFPVTLTRAAVEASPDINTDPPVYRQMEQSQRAALACGPMWDYGGYCGGGLGLPDGEMFNMSSGQSHDPLPTGDPHLRSIAEVVGYHIHALDGDIGHVADFLVDDEAWRIDYAVVDTRNWGFGKHVLVAPAEISLVDWTARCIHLELTRTNIRSGHSWQEPGLADLPAATPPSGATPAGLKPGRTRP
jgi:hypothetical protein